MADVASADFLSAVRKSGLLTDAQVAEVFDGDPPTDPRQCAAALVKAGKLTTYQAAQLLAGKTRGFKLGPYTLLKPIGQGGMGVVYLADHTALGRKVAVKVLPPDKAKDKINLERFNREARAAAALDHPNIVRLHDICCEGGLNFLVFEYVEGRDLQSLLSETGPLHFAQAAHYVAQAAAGLYHAHQRGLVHRDIKPSNLMLARDGTVKLLDLGLARSFSDERDNLTGTLGDDGDIVGTVDYLSPEQCRNALIDERSDVYSLGATLFTLVTGHAPFNGTTAQKLMQHQLTAPPGLERLRARIPEALCDVLARMMAKAPRDRYQTAEEVVLALAPWVPAQTTGIVMGGAATLPEFQTGNSSMRRRAGADAPAAGPARGRKPVLVAAAVGLLGALSVGGLLAWALSGSTPSAGPGAGPAAPAAPAAQPAPAAPARGTGPLRVVYRMDTSRVEPFREVGDSKNSPKQDHLTNVLPGWQGQSYKEGTKGEFRAERDGDRVVLGVAYKPGDNCAQWTFRPQQAGNLKLTPGQKYQVQVEYKTDPKARGWVSVTTIGEWAEIARVTLPESATWRTATLDVTIPETKELQFAFGLDGDPGVFLRLRSFEILDPTAAPNQAAAAGRVVYRMDTSRVEPFREVSDSKNLPKYDHLSNVLPGWQGQTYKEGTEAEFLAERDGRAVVLGVAPKLGENTAQWVFRPRAVPGLTLTPGKSYQARVEYKTDAGASGWASLATMDDWAKIGGGALPESTEWKSVTFAFTPREEKELQFSFGTSGAPGRFLRIRGFEISESSGAAGREVFRLSAADVPEFRNTKGNGKTEGAAEKLPGGVYFFPHNQGTVGTFACETADGAKALRWANLSGEPTGQIGIELERPEGGPWAATAPLAAGGRYRVAVTYKTLGGTKGGAYLQTQNTFEGWDDCGTDLPDTGGAWHTRTFVTTKPDKPVRMLVDNHGVGADKAMLVREVSVHELTDDGRVLYALDLSGQKPLRERGRARTDERGNWRWESAEKTGPGALPGGWSALPWKLDVETEYTAEEVDGRMALGMRTPNRDEGHAMLLTPHIGFPSDRARLTVEYRTGTGSLYVKFHRTLPTGATAVNVKALPATNGAWRTEVVEVKLGGATAGFFEFHNNTGGQPAYLRAVAVADVPGTALRPTGRVLAALDLGGQKPFTVTGTSEPTGDKGEDVRFVEKARTGDGAMPAGWRGLAWDGTGEAAFFVAEKGGRMALGMRNAKTGTARPATFTGMLFAPRLKLPAGPVRLRFTYLTDAEGPTLAQVKLKPTAPDGPLQGGPLPIPGLEKLPGTGGQWVTKEVDVEPNGATDGYFEFHSFDLDTARGFYLSEFTVSELAPAAAAPAVMAAPAAPVRADFGAFKEGTFAFIANGVDTAGRTNIETEGWWFNEFHPNATGELVVATENGARVATLVNKTGEPSAQLFQTKPGPALVAGRQYMLTFEYRAAEGTGGLLQVRERNVGNWKDCPYSYPLDATGGKWEKRTFEVEVPRDYPTVFVIQNLTAGAGNSLSIRKLELVPVGGP